MKRILIITLLSVFALGIIACNSAKKAEAERKRTEQKMEKLDKDKEQFKQENK